MNEISVEKENTLLKWSRWLFAQECTFLKSVPHVKDLLPCTLPEVAFIGRSNVGKSSLINALTGKKNLARTSNTPGRTQLLNFFRLHDELILVDMPGYGYAEAPKALVAQWQKLIREYLLGRPTLKRVYVLIDSRHGLKENDMAFMKMLDETAVSYHVVLTKTDKIKPSQLQTVVLKTKEQLEKFIAAYPLLSVTSSEKGEGLDELKAEIAKLSKSYSSLTFAKEDE